MESMGNPKGVKDSSEDSFITASRELLESFLAITGSDFNKHTFTYSTIVNNEFPEIDVWKWIKPELIKEVLHH